MELASRGNISNVDLQIQDISRTPLPGLPLSATASNFGKVRNLVSDEDIAVGIINMVLQVIAKSAILSSLNSNITNFVMTGNLAKFPQCKDVFQTLEPCFMFISSYRTRRNTVLPSEQRLQRNAIWK